MYTSIRIFDINTGTCVYDLGVARALSPYSLRSLYHQAGELLAEAENLVGQAEEI